MATVPFVIELDEELKASLECEANREHQSASELANAAIHHYLTLKNAKRQIVETALGDAAEGAFISEEAMTRWFHSLGTEEELPEPEPDIQDDNLTHR